MKTKDLNGGERMSNLTRSFLSRHIVTPSVIAGLLLGMAVPADARQALRADEPTAEARPGPEVSPKPIAGAEEILKWTEPAVSESAPTLSHAVDSSVVDEIRQRVIRLGEDVPRRQTKPDSPSFEGGDSGGPSPFESEDPPQWELDVEVAAQTTRLNAIQQQIQVLLADPTVQRELFDRRLRPSPTRVSVEPYLASDEEIDAVIAAAASLDVFLEARSIRIASKRWYANQPLQVRVLEAITLGAVLTAAAIGALLSLGQYFVDVYYHGEPFTCVGATKALLSGAVTGALTVPFAVVKAIDLALGSVKAIRTLQQGVSFAFDLEIPAWLETTADVMDWVFGIIDDSLLVQLNPAIALGCGALSLVTARPGNLSEFKAWYTTSMEPILEETFFPSVLSLSQSTDQSMIEEGGNPAQVNSMAGRLELLDNSTGRTAAAFRSNVNQTALWSLELQPGLSGSYEAELRLFRGGLFRKTLATRSFSTGAPNQRWTTSGTLTSSVVFADGGSVEGTHELRVFVRKSTGDWSDWLRTADGSVLATKLELRANRAPTVSMDYVGIPNIMGFSLFVVDPDGDVPQSVVLNLDGSDIGISVPSCANWASGCAIDKLVSKTTGVHLALARVSDGYVTAYSSPSPQSLRLANPPYLEFPPVPLGRVGESKLLTVRWRDNLGGIPAQGISLESDKLGSFTDPSTGDAIARVVTDSSGYASFRYTPGTTGTHTLSVSTLHFGPSGAGFNGSVQALKLSQSSAVSPGCEPPGRPWLEDPEGNDVPTSTTLVFTDESDAGSYDVYFGTANPPPFLVRIDATHTDSHVSVPVNGLQAGEIYWWKVVARGACDPNLRTESFLEYFSTVGGPGPVTLLSPANGATGQASTLVVQWANVTAPGSFLYDLYLGTTNPPPFLESVGTESMKLLTGLASNTRYYWKIRAKNADDTSLTGDSEVWTFQTGAGSALTHEAPLVKDAMIRGGSFTNRNYGGDVNGGNDSDKKFYYCGNYPWFSDGNGNAPDRGLVQFDLSGIPSGATIANAYIQFPLSGFTYQSWTAPLGMKIIPLTAAWTEHGVTWASRPALNTTYQVNGSIPTSGFNPLRVTVTSLVQAWASGTIPNHGFEVSIPEWETKVEHTVFFYQREFEQDLSAGTKLFVVYSLPCVAPANPSSPSPPSGAVGVGESTTLDWADVPGASNFRVYFGETNPPPQVGVANVSQFGVSGMQPSRTYYWKVEALADCDGSLTSSSSVWSMTTASFAVKPAAPTGLAAEPATATSISFYWADNSSNEDGFRVERKDDGGGWTGVLTVGAGVTSGTVGGIGSCAAADYRVVAYSAAGDSLPSNQVSASPLGCPTASRFWPVQPCRLLDSRSVGGGPEGAPFASGETRVFGVADQCGVPSDAKAIVANVTATQSTSPGSIAVYPGSGPSLNINTVSFASGRTKAGAAILTVNQGVVSIRATQPAGTVHVIMDVSGYFR